MILSVVGARPNFVKMAPVIKAIAQVGLPQTIVHTRQHYSAELSELFMEKIGFPTPDIFLPECTGDSITQTAHIFDCFAELCRLLRPSLVVLAGDVNSTLACALAASKLQIPIAHIESGLRSFDKTMPEEVNRIVVDHLAQILFTTEESANCNLSGEGIAAEKVHFCGNTMIDSLQQLLEGTESVLLPWISPLCLERGYGVVTLHRPENVDSAPQLKHLVRVLDEIATSHPLVFPLHPRTVKRLEEFGIGFSRVRCVPALSYPEFITLIAGSRVVLTDSGGVQEETSYLGIPCLTLRNNTERPVTIDRGTNRLIGTGQKAIEKSLQEVFSAPKAQRITSPGIPLWDGCAGVRIAEELLRWYTQQTRCPQNVNDSVIEEMPKFDAMNELRRAKEYVI